MYLPGLHFNNDRFNKRERERRGPGTDRYFFKMIKGEGLTEEEQEKLGDALVLKNISYMPARVKCAVLAWHTLKELIKS